MKLERLSRGRLSATLRGSVTGFLMLAFAVMLPWQLSMWWGLLWLFVIWRGRALGVYASASQLVVKEWFRTYRVDLETIRVVRVAIYDGTFNMYHFPAFLDRIKVVEITVQSKPRAPMRFNATISLKKTCQRTCEEIEKRRLAARARHVAAQTAPSVSVSRARRLLGRGTSGRGTVRWRRRRP